MGEKEAVGDVVVKLIARRWVEVGDDSRLDLFRLLLRPRPQLEGNSSQLQSFTVEKQWFHLLEGEWCGVTTGRGSHFGAESAEAFLMRFHHIQLDALLLSSLSIIRPNTIFNIQEVIMNDGDDVLGKSARPLSAHFIDHGHSSQTAIYGLTTPSERGQNVQHYHYYYSTSIT